MKAAIYNCHFWVSETRPYILKAKYDFILRLSKFKIKKFNEVYFKPFGYSAFWLLAESHFAIHTFPEHKKTYCELSSCNKPMFITFKKQTILKK